MSKYYKRYLQKCAVLGLAVMLIASPSMQPDMIYGAQIGSTEESEPDLVTPKATEKEPAEESEPVLVTPGASEKEPSEDPVQSDVTDKKEETKDENQLADALKNAATTISNDAVFQIRIGYEFEDGSFDEWARGSGFLINDKYLLTSQTLADMSTNSILYSRIVQEKADMYKKIGVTLTDAETTEAHIKIYITNTNGEKIELNDTISKNGMGVIILKKAVTTSACIFASESKLTFAPDDTVNLKFAGKDDFKAVIQTTTGTIFIPEDADSTKSGFYFKADTTTGSALGAPIYNGNGNIIGMVFSISSQDVGSVTAIDQIVLQTFLASNNIDFKTLAQVQEEQKAAAEEQARKDAEAALREVAEPKKLEEAIKNTKEIKRSYYTDESLKDLDDAIADGQKILDSRAKTQTQVDTATKKINDAMDNLVSKTLLERIFSSVATMVIGITLITVVAIIFIITFIKRKRKKVKVDKKGTSRAVENNEEYDYSEELRNLEKEDLKMQQSTNLDAEKIKIERSEETPSEKRDQGTVPNVKKSEPVKKDIYSDFGGEDFDEEDEDLDVTTRVKPKSDRIPGSIKQKGITYAENVYDDNVSILDEEGAENTTVLNDKVPKGYLIRLDNKKRIEITKDNFLIGKERKKVDYCIGGDPSVSRIHAMIRIISNGFYIEDQDSTNYTFVNNNQIPAYRAVFIQDGSIIRLSDVEFEFHED